MSDAITPWNRRFKPSLGWRCTMRHARQLLLFTACIIGCALPRLMARGISEERNSEPPLAETSNTGHAPQAHLWPMSPEWQPVAIKVAKAAVRMFEGHAFYKALWYWSEGSPSADRYPFSPPINIHVVNGDLETDLVAADHALILVLGDVRADMAVGDHAEIVIGGSVLAGANIEAPSIASVFVGGNVLGSITTKGMLHCWISGDFQGGIVTSSKDFCLRIEGDFTGNVQPIDNDADVRMSLDVGGFMSRERMDSIPRTRLVCFRANVFESDQTPGIHSDRSLAIPQEFWWVVQSQRD